MDDKIQVANGGATQWFVLLLAAGFISQAWDLSIAVFQSSPCVCVGSLLILRLTPRL